MIFTNRTVFIDHASALIIYLSLIKNSESSLLFCINGSFSSARWRWNWLSAAFHFYLHIDGLTKGNDISFFVHLYSFALVFLYKDCNLFVPLVSIIVTLPCTNFLQVCSKFLFKHLRLFIYFNFPLKHRLALFLKK